MTSKWRKVRYSHAILISFIAFFSKLKRKESLSVKIQSNYKIQNWSWSRKATLLVRLKCLYKKLFVRLLTGFTGLNTFKEFFFVLTIVQDYECKEEKI